MSRPLAALLLAGLTCAACASSRTSPILGEDVKSTLASTLSASTAVSAPAPSTSSAAAPTPAPGVQSTTSTTSEEDVRRAIAAGFDAGERAYLAALADPTSFDPVTIEATYAPGDTRTNVIAALNDLKAQGFRYRAGPQGLDYYVIEGVRLTDGPPVDRAELSTCQVSDGVVYDPRDPSNPNDDAIVNDELGTHRYVWTMVVVNGRWQRLSASETEHKVGVNACPPKH